MRAFSLFILLLLYTYLPSILWVFESLRIWNRDCCYNTNTYCNIFLKSIKFIFSAIGDKCNCQQFEVAYGVVLKMNSGLFKLFFFLNTVLMNTDNWILLLLKNTWINHLNIKKCNEKNLYGKFICGCIFSSLPLHVQQMCSLVFWFVNPVFICHVSW